MLRITITNTMTEERSTLHGRLVTPWVDELKAAGEGTPRGPRRGVRRESR